MIQRLTYFFKIFTNKLTIVSIIISFRLVSKPILVYIAIHPTPKRVGFPHYSVNLEQNSFNVSTEGRISLSLLRISYSLGMSLQKSYKEHSSQEVEFLTHSVLIICTTLSNVINSFLVAKRHLPFTDVTHTGFT